MNADIVISGGGIAGMIAAAVFGQAGFDVICADPAPPITDKDTAGADMRSTAFLARSVPLLQESGIWARLESHACPLNTMRIIDAAGGQINSTTDFTAAEVGAQSLGYNFPNWLLRREIFAHLSDMANVRFRMGIATTAITARTDGAQLRFSDGIGAWARLVIAADGRDSFVRRSLGISVSTHDFGQKALAFAVAHPLPHDNISTEIHQSGGPFTLVPLPGQHHSAVVWMDAAARITALHRLPAEEFANAVNTRSCGVLGQLTPVGQIALWPIISQRAKTLTAARIALIAEAAHVMPPIGAQGLNMSLADIKCLYDLAVKAPEQLGESAMLSSYARTRAHDISMRMNGIALLNTISISAVPVVQRMRAKGLSLLGHSTHIKHKLMNMGLGVTTKN